MTPQTITGWAHLEPSGRLSGQVNGYGEFRLYKSKKDAMRGAYAESLTKVVRVTITIEGDG